MAQEVCAVVARRVKEPVEIVTVHERIALDQVEDAFPRMERGEVHRSVVVL